MNPETLLAAAWVALSFPQGIALMASLIRSLASAAKGR